MHMTYYSGHVLEFNANYAEKSSLGRSWIEIRGAGMCVYVCVEHNSRTIYVM